MSDTRGRPVLKKLEGGRMGHNELEQLAQLGKVWIFCGEYGGSSTNALDDAEALHGLGIYKVFPSGSWAGGYLRD